LSADLHAGLDLSLDVLATDVAKDGLTADDVEADDMEADDASTDGIVVDVVTTESAGTAADLRLGDLATDCRLHWFPIIPTSLHKLFKVRCNYLIYIYIPT
jgi:hypothetical protein